MLADARLNHLTIKEVMYRAGFSNFSHFCYAFRQRFGCTAGELRQRGTRPPSPDSSQRLAVRPPRKQIVHSDIPAGRG